MDKRRRRAIIREMIETAPPASQRELVAQLTARGIEADQSTVSRDLREMGAVRLPGAGGATVYGFPGEKSAFRGEEELRRGARDYVIAAEASGNLVILRTAPGNAQAMAAILDRTRLEEVAGTVAGDDTILVIAPDPPTAELLRNRFVDLLEAL